MEKAIITGVAHDTSEAKVTVHGVPDRPGLAAQLFGPLADEGIDVDMIVQNVGDSGTTDISFTVAKEHAAAAFKIVEILVPEMGAAGADLDENVAKVSLVGAGMRSNPGIAASMFATLAENNINISMISTSAIRISCIIHSDRVQEAVSALHGFFVPPEEPVAEVGA